MNKIPIHLYELSKHFEAHLEKSTRRFRRYKRHDIEWYADPKSTVSDDVNGYQVRVEEIDGVAIHIPDHRVDDFLSCIDERRVREMEVRNAVPAVKKAYEQYRLLLKMCGGAEDAGY